MTAKTISEKIKVNFQEFFVPEIVIVRQKIVQLFAGIGNKVIIDCSFQKIEKGKSKKAKGKNKKFVFTFAFYLLPFALN